MRQKAVWQKLKSFGSFCLILLLLPYIVTVFVHGKDFKANRDIGTIYVNVKRAKGTAGFTQIESTLDMVGMGSATGSGRYQEVNSNAADDSLIVEVPWEEYFVGILAREVPADADTEFLKAQAVLVRTKLYQELDSQRTDTAANADSNVQGSTKVDNPKRKILDDPYLTRQELEEKQGGSDIDIYYDNLLQAMQATENQVLFYQDTYAWAPFHQSSNGMTRSAQEVLGLNTYPYLAVRECPLDKEAEDEMQITTFEYKEVQTKCQPFLVAVAEEDADRTYGADDFEIISYDSAGYVMQMRIGDTICTGDQFRDALSLTSSAFSIKDAEGKLKVTTIGKGHGLGLSQWTAQQMAKEGKSYEEILQFFFEGTSLTDGGDITEKIEIE